MYGIGWLLAAALLAFCGGYTAGYRQGGADERYHG